MKLEFARKVKTESVSIKRVTVTIQSVQINDKQMTLSVFRQLEQTYSLEGEHWGMVRYAMAAVNLGDLWLVLSRDGKLFRYQLAFKFIEEEKITMHRQLAASLPQLFIAV